MSKLKEKGITLVVLVVTVIILLILAGVTISQIGGNNGLFSRVKKAVGQYKNASLDEESSIKEIEKHLSEFEILGGDKTDEGVKVTIKNFEATQEGKNIKAIVTIEGQASKIEYSLDGEIWENDESNEKNIEYTFKEVKIGSYNVRVRVYDEEGKKTEAMKLVTVIDTDINIANDEEVLKGKKYYDGEREQHTGTMENRGDLNITVPEEGITLYPGYYEGGTIKAKEKEYDKGGLDLELLWENKNPDIAFGAQKIELDLSGYESIAIRVKSANQLLSRSMITLLQIGWENRWICGEGVYISLGGGAVPGREITLIDNTGVTFGRGASNYLGHLDPIYNDNNSIPIQIYGVRQDKINWFE